MASGALAICICTMDRPTVLARCLASIAEGVRQPEQIIVSDDSKDSTETRRTCRNVPNVIYVRGPRRGLCANRNHVISQVKTDYVSLLDDDAILSKMFVADVAEMIPKFNERTILTGIVREAGDIIIPSNSFFLGHFGKPTKGKLRNINLNCNVFPRSAFDVAKFDEAIEYGYEDTDLCASLLSEDYHIEFVPTLWNEHAPPPRTSAERMPLLRSSERARFYTSVKRYMIWEKNLLMLVVYVVWAIVHRSLSAMKKTDWRDLIHNISDMYDSILLACREKRRLVNPH